MLAKENTSILAVSKQANIERDSSIMKIKCNKIDWECNSAACSEATLADMKEKLVIGQKVDFYMYVL